MIGCCFKFPSRFQDRPQLSTRQYARLVRDWMIAIGWSQADTGPILFAELNWRRYTEKLGTLGRKSFLDTLRWAEPSDTSRSNSKPHPVSLNRPTSVKTDRQYVPFGASKRSYGLVASRSCRRPKEDGVNCLGILRICGWLRNRNATFGFLGTLSYQLKLCRLARIECRGSQRSHGTQGLTTNGI